MGRNYPGLALVNIARLAQATLLKTVPGPLFLTFSILDVQFWGNPGPLFWAISGFFKEMDVGLQTPPAGTLPDLCP